MMSLGTPVSSFRSARLFFCVAVSVLLAAPKSTAQKTVDVYYTHSSPIDPDRIQLSYRLPGQDTGFRAGGLRVGDRISVLQGGQSCFHIGNSNPLLYTYSRSAAAIEIKPPEGLAALLTSLQTLGGLMGGEVPAGSSFAAIGTLDKQLAVVGLMPSRPIESRSIELVLAYSNALTQLQATLKDIELLRLQDEGDWESEFQKAKNLVTTARDKVKTADTAFSRASKAPLTDDEKALLKQLNVLQGITTQRVDAIAKEFNDANSRVGEPLCTKVDKDRIKMTLSIKSRLTENKEPKFAVKDDLVSIELNPVSDAFFELAPLVIVAPNVRRDKFSVKSNLIASDPDEDPLVRPGLLALGRLWNQGWLWAGVGATKGKEATPDYFFGIVARPGLSLVGTQLSVGAGLGMFQVPVGLKQGVVGEPLPSNVGNLDKILQRGYRSGLAITFSISGLELGGSSASK